jgi:hypothetical protein
MRKLGLAIAVASALGATSSAVQAYGIGMYANGLLVPYAAVGETAVGLTSIEAGIVHWYFMDVNSKKVTDGTFRMTKNDYHSFIWDEKTAGGNIDEPGYLVFLLDTSGAFANGGPDGNTSAPDGKLLPECAGDKEPKWIVLDYGTPVDVNGRCLWTKGNPNDEQPKDIPPKARTGDQPALAGNAFQVDVARDDIVFQPTVPLAIHDFAYFDLDILPPELKIGIGSDDLSVIQENSQFFMVWGAWAGELLSMRYYVDYKPGGNDTNVYYWSVCKPPVSQDAQAYDDKQTRKSIKIPLPNNELNWFDVEDLQGMPTAFTDGLINITVDFAVRENFEPDTSYCDFVNPRGWGNPPEGPLGDNALGDQYWPIDLLPNLGGIQSVVSWSVVRSEGFGATQTLINPHLWDHFWLFDLLEIVTSPNGK